MMTTITLTLTGAQAEAQVEGLLTSGMAGVGLYLSWDRSWDGLTKTLVCQSDAGTFCVFGVEDTAVLPSGVLAFHPQGRNQLWLGVEGRSADGQVVYPSTLAWAGAILPGATGESPRDLKEKSGILAAVLNKIGQTEQLETENHQDLVSAINELAGKVTPPVRGVDYWTEDDQTRILAQVLDALGTVPVYGQAEGQALTLRAALDPGTYTVYYAPQEGQVLTVGAFTLAEPQTGGNLFQPDTAALNTRWYHRDSVYNTLNGYVTTDYIPLPPLSGDEDAPTLLHIRGADWAGQASIVYFDQSKALLPSPSAEDGHGAGTDVDQPSELDENGDTCLPLGYRRGVQEACWLEGSAAYIRLTLQVNSYFNPITLADIQDIVVTIDEPIPQE